MADKTAHGFSPSIIKHAQQVYSHNKGQDSSFDAFLKRLDSPESSASLPIENDASHPLSHYFISSSHNTYLFV